MRASGILLACAWLCAGASAASAQQADGPLKSVAKLFGFATDVNPAADFVTQSRPSQAGDYIPIFQPPPEPKKPVLNDKQFKAMKGDLDSVEKRDDGLRAGFPPAAKAVAEAKAAEQKNAAAKAAAKAQANPSAPQQ
jgi:hypothetical protein